jgi:hypothetical protein
MKKVLTIRCKIWIILPRVLKILKELWLWPPSKSGCSKEEKKRKSRMTTTTTPGTGRPDNRGRLPKKAVILLEVTESHTGSGVQYASHSMGIGYPFLTGKAGGTWRCSHVSWPLHRVRNTRTDTTHEWNDTYRRHPKYSEKY